MEIPKEEIEDYDFIILGTGLSESIIGCKLALHHKVLYIDTNKTYGSDLATLSYKQIQSHFGRSERNDEEEQILLKNDRLFNIDLTPKLLLMESPMKDFLLKINIEDLVQFTYIKETYLYSDTLHSIPRNEIQALTSSLVQFFQKLKLMRFFNNCRRFYANRKITTKKTMREEFKGYGINEDIMDFIGHAIALHLNDEYLDEHPYGTYERIERYVLSIASYEGAESPYIYPMYGISEICQGLARKSAIQGSTFMMYSTPFVLENKSSAFERLNMEDIEKGGMMLRVLDPDGNSHLVRGKKIVSDPSYFSNTTVCKQMIRCILIVRNDNRYKSRSIIFLKKNLKRTNDIFAVVLGKEEKVCPEGYEIVVVSTIKETDDPEKELESVVSKFDVIRKYIEVKDCYENKGSDNIIFTSPIDQSVSMDNIYYSSVNILQKISGFTGKEYIEVDGKSDIL